MQTSRSGKCTKLHEKILNRGIRGIRGKGKFNTEEAEKIRSDMNGFYKRKRSETKIGVEY